MKGNINLPPQGKSTSATPQTEAPSQGPGVVNCCRKDLHPGSFRDPRSTSFLSKCNLTKS